MAFEVSVKTEEEVHAKVLGCDYFQDEAQGKKFVSARSQIEFAIGRSQILNTHPIWGF